MILPARTLANPVVPTFRTGSQTTNSTSQSVINETITSHQYRTGYTYSASGNNIKSNDTNGYINPTPQSDTITTINRTINTTTTVTVEATFGQ